MKIQHIAGQTPVVSPTTTQPASGRAVDFQNLLASRLAAMQESAPTTASRPTAALSAIIPPALRLAGLDLTETTLDTLDAYGKALGNTAIDGAGLEPFIAAMEDETAGLLDLKQQLPIDDPLAKMLEQVATVTFLESAKFRRGDYQA